MLIALLAVLGVDLIVIVVLLALVISRKRWVKHREGVFRGAIRVTEGEVDGLGAKWKRGYGRWVRDILVWTKAPLLFRNVLVPSDGLKGERSADPGELKRLGDEPIVIELATGAATVEIAAGRDQRDRVRGPSVERPSVGTSDRNRAAHHRSSSGRGRDRQLPTDGD